MRLKQTITMFLLSAALALPAAAQQTYCASASCAVSSKVYRDGYTWVQEITGSISSAKGLRFHSAIGSVQVVGVDQPNVTYTVKKKVNLPSEAEARRHMSALDVNVSRRNAEMVVFEAEWGAQRSGRVTAEYFVNVPKDMQSVKVDTLGGTVTVKNIAGKVMAYTAGGNIVADNIGGALHATTLGGSIEVGWIHSDAKLSTNGGIIKVAGVGGQLVANTMGGNVHIGTGKQDVSIETSGGSISVKECGGGLRATTAGGSIDIGDVGKWAKLDTGGGSIRLLSSRGDVKANTLSGGIRLAKLGGGVKAETAAGAIEAEFVGSRESFTESYLETSVGDIVIYLPSDLPVTVRAAIELANGHQIRSDMPGLHITDEGGKYGPKEIYAEGSFNGGGPLLKVHTTNGNIIFRVLGKPRQR